MTTSTQCFPIIFKSFHFALSSRELLQLFTQRYVSFISLIHRQKYKQNELEIARSPKLVNPKRNQSWIFIRRTNAKAEAPILWPHDAKSQLIGKDPYAGKDWGQKEMRAIEDEVVGWYQRLNGHEFEQVLGVGEGQAGLECCSHGLTKGWTWLSDWTTTAT